MIRVNNYEYNPTNKIGQGGYGAVYKGNRIGVRNLTEFYQFKL